MRIITVPAAVLLSMLLYWAWQTLPDQLARILGNLYATLHEKNPGWNHKKLLIVCLLIPSAASFLLSLIHPVVSCILMTPLFPAFSMMAQGADIKETLDKGKYRSDRAGYEEQVRTVCRKLAPSFVCDTMVPILLCSIGTPLYLGASIGWAYLTLRAISGRNRFALQIVTVSQKPMDAVFCFLLSLWSGIAGRNPLRVGGHPSSERLLNVLGIGGEKTHQPMAGDISLGVLMCIICCLTWCIVLTAVLYGVCR